MASLGGLESGTITYHSILKQYNFKGLFKELNSATSIHITCRNGGGGWGGGGGGGGG